jgi:dihydrolipoamide dehydrogenase
LGIQVFGPSASEILQQGLIAMDADISSEGFSSSIFSHPTVSEALHEATLAMNSKAIHIRNKKKT